MARSRPLRRIAVGAAGALGFAALLACNGIIGLSDFQRVECTGNVCGDAAFDVVTIDAPKDAPVSPDSGRGTEPVSWARWPMPNYVSDASLPNPPNVTAGAEGELNDGITGLVWKKRPTSGTVALEDARKACADIAPAGTWRLPKRIELVTLLDYGHPKPLIVSAFGADFPRVRVWSSSEARQFDSGTQYWAVSFDDGLVTIEDGTQLAAEALCVKAAAL